MYFPVKTGNLKGCPRIRNVTFYRATVFRPNDLRAKEVYGVYLYKSGRLHEARAQFYAAEADSYDEPLFHYNFGLLLVDMREWDKAFYHAKKAYDSGVSFPWPEEKASAERQMEIS